MPGASLIFPASASELITDIDCVRVGDRAWKDQVRTRVQGHGRSRAVFESILKLAETELQARTVLIEPYISTDWADEYAAWYARIFRDIPRRASRLHFFSGIGTPRGHLTKGDLFNLPAECLRQDASPYLGYCVVRPFNPLTISETVLASPYHEGGASIVHCLPRFSAHILGHELTVRGMPFMQQDQAVSVCAQANLWMVARYMNAQGEARRYRPTEMTELANRAFSVGATREGLIASQMFAALQQIGLNPELIHPNAEDALRLLCTAVDSEIPVIVAIPGHVITVIGHTYAPKWNRLGVHDSAAGYVDSFIAHDDQRGPYRKLRVGMSRGRRDKPDQLTLEGKPVQWCLVPMPARVHLRESDVRLMVAEWLRDLPGIGAQVRTFWKQADVAGLTTRTYLRRSDKFKMDICPPRDDPRWSEPGLTLRSPELIARYWCQTLPRYVWIVELAGGPHAPWYDPKRQRITGEMIFDSTSHFNDTENSLISVHLNGRLLYSRSQDTETMGFLDNLPSGPYSPLVRHF